LASKQTDQHINFVHAARNESVHAFHDHVTELVSALPNANYMYGYSDLNSENHGDFKGYLTKEVLKQATKENSVYYVVGPIPFMKNLVNLLNKLVVNNVNIRNKLFGLEKEILKKPTAKIVKTSS